MKVQEGSAVVSVPEKTSREEVFYNPASSSQRDVLVKLLNAVRLQKVRAADALAGCGVRGIRLLKEVKKVTHVALNDANAKAVKLIKKNLKANKIKSNFSIDSKDAAIFLHETSGFNYIDIDPFGSPVPFLDAACKKIVKPGILGITATDTAALTGSAVRACVRKYWSRPLKNEFMYETGMRILIHKVQLIASQFEKCLTPIYCHGTSHYVRVYVKCEKSKELKNMFSQHGFIHYCFRCLKRLTSRSNQARMCCKARMSVAGPLWLGRLWDGKLAKKVDSVVAEESEIPVVGFFSTHEVARKLKRSAPKQERLVAALKKRGFRAVVTSFSPTGIRTDANVSEFKKVFRAI